MRKLHSNDCCHLKSYEDTLCAVLKCSMACPNYSDVAAHHQQCIGIPCVLHMPIEICKALPPLHVR
eukprot:698384-Amphidinium_carterae.1